MPGEAASGTAPSRNIRVRLLMLFGLSMFALIALGLYAAAIYRDSIARNEAVRSDIVGYVHLAQSAQASFRNTLAAWNNVLLRGHEGDDYHVYLSAFYERERATRRLLGQLRKRLAERTELTPLLEETIYAHMELGRRLRDGLRVYNASTEQPHVVADRYIDRGEQRPDALLGQLVALVERDHDVRLREIDAQLRRQETHLLWAVLAVVVGATLLFVWRIDRRVGQPAEQAMHLAEMIQRAQDVAGFGNWEYDLAAGQLYWSEGLYRLLGIAPTEAASLQLHLAAVCPPDRPRLRQFIDRAMAEGAAYNIEYHLRECNEQAAVVFERAEVVRDASGRPARIIAIVSNVTARAHAEQALRESHAQLLQAQQVARIGSWELDLSSNRLSWSDETFRIFEIDRGRFGASYEAFLNIVHPDDRDRVNRAYTQSVQTRQPYDITHRLLMPDGRIKHVEERCETFYDEHGIPLRSVGTVQDITERLEMESAMTRFGRILDQTANEIYQFDAQTLRFVQVNQGARHNLGYSMEELKGLTPVDLKPEFTVETFAKLVQPLRDGQVDRLRFETNHRRKDGSSYPVEVNLQLARQETPPLYVAVIQDLTERRAAEATQRRLMGILEATPDFVGISDVAGRSLYVNPAGRRLMGFTANQDLSGLTIADFHPSEVAATLVEQALPVAVRDGVWQGETWFQARDGRRIPTLQIIIAHKSDNGVVDYLSTIARDITERKRAERDLRRHRDRLEYLVNQRTAALKAVNAELESFNYSVSHDLRAPLRAIDGFSQALLEDYQDVLDETGQDYLRRVRAGAQRMGALIDDLLQLSRTTRAEMHRERLDMSALAAEVVADLQVSEPGREPRMVIEPQLEAAGDPQLIRTVLSNLLGNAWKFTSRTDQPVIEFGRSVTEQGPAFYVRDNGAGFDMEYSGKLFGVFQRLHREAEYPGTGVGLATVQRIVHRHGGRIWAQAEVGRGATFYFTLPGTAVADQTSTRTERATHAASSHLAG